MNKNFKNKFKSYEFHPLYNKSCRTTEKILNFLLCLIMGICLGVYFLFELIQILIFSIPFIILLVICWYALGKIITLSMIFIVIIMCVIPFIDIEK